MTNQADYPPLRPCPFCGKVPTGVELDDEWPQCDTTVSIQCSMGCGEWITIADSKAEAADKWNRRAKL